MALQGHLVVLQCSTGFFVTFGFCYCIINIKSVTQVLGSGFTVGRFALFIFLDIVDEPMNGSSYAQCATPQYLKTVQFSSLTLNREPLNFEPELQSM